MRVLNMSRCTCVFVALLLMTRVFAQSAPDLVQQIADVMSQGPSGKAHQRYIHAKGIVCQGTFQASPEAAAISRAAHFQGERMPVTVRFSDGAPDIAVADNSPAASPRGMAIRFATGRGTDIMAISHNGFIVGTGEEFLALEKAIAATDSSKPHPWSSEAFMATHPRALKFVQELNRVPASFATELFYSNNSLIFVNGKQEKHAGRYQIVPVEGGQYLNESVVKAMSPNFLSEELSRRLATAPAKFRLLLQLAEPGDQTNDGSVVWPDDRRKVELGVITITSIVPDSAEAERALAFDPTRLIDGIELSDDPAADAAIPSLRLFGRGTQKEIAHGYFDCMPIDNEAHRDWSNHHLFRLLLRSGETWETGSAGGLAEADLAQSRPAEEYPADDQLLPGPVRSSERSEDFVFDQRYLARQHNAVGAIRSSRRLGRSE